MALVINSTTGVIDVSASTAGTYVVSYTVGTDIATQTITILSTPSASISGATSYCAGTGGVTLASSGGQGGDSYIWLKNDQATGLTTSQITGQTNGSYTVTITRPNSTENACVDTSSTFTVTELPSQNSSFNYQNSSYAQDGTDPTPIATVSGGTYNCADNNLIINSTTGQIDLSASAVGTYTVTYSFPAPCPSSTSRTVGITAAAYSSVYSVALDGVNDYLQENYYNALSGQNYFTISLWFYIQFPSSYEVSQNTTFQVFTSAWTNPYLYIVRLNGTNLQFYQRTSTNQTVLTQGAVGTLEHNRWYHVVAVKNGTTNTVYLDGVLKGTNSSTGSMKSANLGNRVGLYGASNGSFLIDEFTQYTTAFTQANVTSQYNNGVPTNPIGSPVNWWKMGEDTAGNGNTIGNDGSGNNYLTRTNGASFRVEPAGIFNQRSIDFDGVNDNVTFGNNANWSFVAEDLDNPLSVSAWVKLDTNGGGILGKYQSNQLEYLFYFTGNHLRFIVRQNTSGFPYKLIHANNVFSAGTWMHLAVTYSGNHEASGYGMKLYKNGTELSTSNAISGEYAGMVETTAPLIMGSYSGNAGAIDGKIDECALFNYELSSTAIGEIYNSGSPQKDLNNLTNATTDPIMWARGGDRDTFSTLTNRGSVSVNGTYTNMAIDDINFEVKT